MHWAFADDWPTEGELPSISSHLTPSSPMRPGVLAASVTRRSASRCQPVVWQKACVGLAFTMGGT